MNVAIIGYGKMGREIEKILIDRGHNVAHIIDIDNHDVLTSEEFKKVDVAIEFTTPATAYANLEACMHAGVPVVSGTTGWLSRYDEMVELCNQNNGALFYASNYSLGVNLMFRLNRRLAAMINPVGGYQVEIEEVHHTQKKDAPSGTAITLAEGIIENLDCKNGWVNDEPAAADQIEIHSVREGATPGIHSVCYTSDDDILELKHTIKRRSALAMGAVVASEFLCGKQGVFSMDDLLSE